MENTWPKDERGWQATAFEHGQIGIPPIEIAIKPGDRVTCYWKQPRAWVANAVAITDGPPITYPQAIDMPAEYGILIVDARLREEEEGT